MGWAFGETVIVRRVTGTTQDGDGNDVPVLTPTTYEGVAVGPGTMTELSSGQTVLLDELHAIWNPAIPLAGVDEIEITTGLSVGTYQVDGDPKQYRSPLSSTSVTDAKLRKVTG